MRAGLVLTACGLCQSSVTETKAGLQRDATSPCEHDSSGPPWACSGISQSVFACTGIASTQTTTRSVSEADNPVVAAGRRRLSAAMGSLAAHICQITCTEAITGIAR